MFELFKKSFSITTGICTGIVLVGMLSNLVVRKVETKEQDSTEESKED